MRFQDFDSPPRYDGIWACASLLHVPLSCSGDAVRRLAGALKHAGALYISFKYGKGERISNDGRLFTDMDEDGVQHLLAGIPELTIAETWQSSGEGTHNGKDLWLNVITRKSV